MRYKLLGRSGLRVSEVALGTMTFGDAWGWGAQKYESRRIFDAFLDAGGNFVDTACNYTDGQSEEFLGEFLGQGRDRVVLATKYTLTAQRDDPNAGGNSRKSMVRALEASLRRLRTDYVDLLWLHMWDGMTPVEEVMRAFDDLVRAGKVLYVGFSDTPSWVVSQAAVLAELRGWSRVVAVQLPLSLADRGAQRDLLPMARALDLAVCAWGTLEGGTLTGKYFSEGGDPRRYSGEPSEAEQALAREVMAVAEETGSSPAQVAINWVRQQPGLVIPIIGARTEEQARDNLASLEDELTSDQLERLTLAAPLSLGFPHSFLASDHVTQLIFGETRPLIDVHRAA